MSIKQQREEFIAQVVIHTQYLPCWSWRDALILARKFLRLSQTHGNLATAYCNGDWPYDGSWNRVNPLALAADKTPFEVFRVVQCVECEADVLASTVNRAGVCKKCRIEAQLKELAASTNGIFTLKLQQDPRGWTVRVVTSNGIEIGVPQHG